MSKINVNAVTPSATGDTLTLGTTGDSVTIPTGGTLKTDKIVDAGGNNIITSDGSGGLTIDSQMAGSMSLVSSQTFDDDASVEFKASAITNFNTAFPIYIIKVINVFPEANGGTLKIGFSDDDGSSYTGFNKTTVFMRWSRQNDDGTARNLEVESSYDLNNSSGDPFLSSADCDDADTSYSGDIWLYNFGVATIHKYYNASMISQYVNTYVAMYGEWSAGAMKAVNDIDAFKIYSSAGNITGTVQLYGLG